MHFVGHSLGGIVLCRYFETTQRSARGPRGVAGLAGRRQPLGERVARHAWLTRVIGPHGQRDELVEPAASAPMALRIASSGCIAGTRPMGLGRFFARFEEDSDGTVGVSETKLPGHTAHLSLPVSHMGMLFSAHVARQVGEFLEVPVEDEARAQLEMTAKMPFIFKHIAVMPDVHVGKGSTVGSVIPTLNAVIPAAVGVDIGCGMIAAKTTLDGLGPAGQPGARARGHRKGRAAWAYAGCA